MLSSTLLLLWLIAVVAAANLAQFRGSQNLGAR
jgi:hypothetical protein